MNKNHLISVTAFLLINIVFFTTSQRYGFAQEGTGLQQLSSEEIREKIGTSALGNANLGAEAQKYYRFLSDSQKQNVIDGLSSNEKVMIFESLSIKDKLSLFRSLTYTEKRNLFVSLSNTGKKALFQSLTDDEKRYFFGILDNIEKIGFFGILDDAEKIGFFGILDDAEKSKLFGILDDAEKEIILNAQNYTGKIKLINNLPEEERVNWLVEYPELEPIIPLKKIPSEIYEEAPPLSDIERILSGQFPTDITRTVRQFGYDFFEKGPTAFVPEMVVPVSPDYIIGPDDNFTINLWGRAEETYSRTVSRDGTITLPRLGTLAVGGLTLSELKSFLLHKFNEYYPDFEMSITMGALRTVEVFIIGEMESPGTYSLNALSSIISALFTSGGPSKNGSLRNIQIFRNGENVKTFDLYEFFIKGTKEDDIRLQQGDTIFIPIIGPVVGVAGNVKRPAIYEMKGEQTISEVIELAGGVLPTGYLHNVVVERIIGNKKRIINSFNLDPSHEKSDLNLKTPLQDGDVIKIYPVYERIEQIVYLEGHVKYPQEYEFKSGMRLLDILPSFDYLLPEPYLPQAEIIRLVPPDLHPEIIEFNLGSLLAGDTDQNLLLQNQDRIRIYSVWEKSEIPEVLISGSVRNPGSYRLYNGMTIKDLIFLAGNLTSNAFTEKADLTRIVSSSTGTDLIKLSVSPQRALEGIPEDNLLLQQDDQLYIREIPKYESVLKRKVLLEGEFLFPGIYSFSESERLSSVIERAGGLTKEAYPFGAVFLRESVKEIQRERQMEYIDKLEQDILTISTYSMETALDPSQTTLLQQTLSSKRDLIEKLRTSQPTGRMIIDISEILLVPSSDNDIELRPGDRLIVGKRPDSVNVMGEVYNPNALLVEKNKRVAYYLSLVGGTTENADKKQIYIVKADGSVVSKQQEKFGLFNWDSQENRWTFGSFNSLVLDPGDTIIVPRKISATSWFRIAQDTTQILYQIAVSAGVLDRIFND